MDIDNTIRQMINRPYSHDEMMDDGRGTKEEIEKVCWQFCREIFALYGKQLPIELMNNLKKISAGEIVIPCIVLFKCGNDWHSGVCWPDGLHFIHAIPQSSIVNPQSSIIYVVRKERLTLWPWSAMREGFYLPGDGNIEK